MKWLVIQIFLINIFTRKYGLFKPLLERKKIKLKLNHSLVLNPGSIKILRYGKVSFNDIEVDFIKLNANLKVDRILASFALISFRKKIRFGVLDNVEFSEIIICVGSVDKDKKPGDTKKYTPSPSSQSYYPLYRKLLSVLFNQQQTRVNWGKITIYGKKINYTARIGNIQTNGKSYFCWVELKSKAGIYKCDCFFEVDHKTRKISLNLKNEGDFNTLQPFSFDKINFIFKEAYDYNEKSSNLYIYIIVKNTNISDRRISQHNFVVPSISLELKIGYNACLFMIREGSWMQIGKIQSSFSSIHENNESDVVKIKSSLNVNIKDFLDIFPVFAGSGFKTIEASGNIHLKALFRFSFTDIKKYSFQLDILENSIVINDFGQIELSYLNGPFQHNITKSHSLIKKISVSDTAPNYLGIDLIQKQFIKVIIFAEDPNFYKHGGVDIAAVGYAIAKNIVTKKFARGASTITMQVARNIFLYHEKNIVRKIEEVIIALLIENYFNISKKRILEIYLNIIEFGPGVYGIVEASSFYFGRQVEDLGLLEWLVIVYIIPRPIHFYDALESKSKILRANLIKHIKNSTKKMLKREIITISEIENIPDEIKFSAKFGTISLGL